MRVYFWLLLIIMVPAALWAQTAKPAEAKDPNEPDAITYKGVTITPGGYLQFAAIYRSKNANSDTSDQYGSYVYPNSANYYMSEFRESGRASRLSMKIDANMPQGMKAMGYVEIDFLGAAGGTETQTNSFAPRLRLAFANVDLPGGWSIAGGQNWSMLQVTKKGMAPLSEWTPSLIDNSYSPGFSYARQGSIRVVKDFSSKAWLGFSLENPDTVATGSCVPTANCPTNIFTNGAIQGLANGPNTTSPNNGYLNSQPGSASSASSVSPSVTGNPSTNKAPDLVAKFAFEPGWGHYEIKAIGRFFRDRVYPNFDSATTPGDTTGAVNKTAHGAAIGIGAIMPVVKKKVDVVIQALAGTGIGRFGVTSGPDVTFRPDGKLTPVKGFQAIVGIETHPTSKFDFNIYGGGDYYKRYTYTIPVGASLFGAAVKSPAEMGYGAPIFDDSKCQIEGGSACSGQAKDVWAIQTQLWYRLYKGKAGTVQFGASYAYVYKRAWEGRGPNGTITNVNGFPVVGGLVGPTSTNNIIMTSFRYYLP